MKNKLTIDFVKNFTPALKRLIVYDTILPSLALFITPIIFKKNGEVSGGHKSFYFIYQLCSKPKKQLYLGSFPEMTPKQARELITKNFQIQVLNGIDPDSKSEKYEDSTLSVEYYFNIFFKEYVIAHLKDNTAKNYSSLSKNHIMPSIGDLKVDEVTPEHIQKIHTKLEDKPASGNRVLALCSKFFSWCEKKDYIARGTVPTKGLPRYKEVPIKKFLNQSQLKLIWDSLLEMEKSSKLKMLPAAALKILLLTGARKNEVLSLQWVDIDFESSRAILQDSKTGFKNIYFPPQVIDILNNLPKNSPFLFPSRSVSGHLFDLQWQWAKVLDETQLGEDWRIHDLRHGFASAAVNSGGTLPLIGFLLGHKRTTTTERYAHVAKNPVQDLLNTVANLITEGTRN
jgi:integrase